MDLIVESEREIAQVPLVLRYGSSSTFFVTFAEESRASGDMVGACVEVVVTNKDRFPKWEGLVVECRSPRTLLGSLKQCFRYAEIWVVPIGGDDTIPIGLQPRPKPEEHASESTGDNISSESAGDLINVDITITVREGKRVYKREKIPALIV